MSAPVRPERDPFEDIVSRYTGGQEPDPFEDIVGRYTPREEPKPSRETYADWQVGAGRFLARQAVSVGRQVAKVPGAIYEGAKSMITHPIQTAGAIIQAPIRSAGEALGSPVVGEVRQPGAMSWKVGPVPGAGPRAETYGAVTEETPGAISEEQMLLGGLQTAANVAAGPIAGRVGALAAARGAGPLLARTAGAAAAGAPIGAAYDPEEPVKGALSMAVLAAPFPAVERGVGVGVKATARGAVRAGEGIRQGVQSAAETIADRIRIAREARARGVPEAVVEDLAAEAAEAPPAPVVPERQVDRQPGPETPPAVTEAPAPAVSEAVPGQVNVVRFPVAELVPDPARFQFKRGTDPVTGVGGELKDVRTFDESLAGVVSVWRDPETGQVHPVNGHHRTELAKRAGKTSINVQFIDAATPEEARAIGAIQNIAEGRGTPIDAAVFFRDSGLGPEQLAERVSFKGSIAKKGTGLSRLEPDIFDRVQRGELSEDAAAVIGAELPDAAMQRTAAKVVAGKRLSEGEVREVVRQVREAGTETITEMSLFGEEQMAQSLFLEKAQLAEGIRKRLANDKRIFGYVAKEGRAEQLAKAGNVIDVETSQKLATESAQATEAFERLYTKSGPVGSALTEAARRVAQGEKVGRVLDDIYPGIREATEADLRQALAGRGEEGAGSGRPADTAGDREAGAGELALERQDARRVRFRQGSPYDIPDNPPEAALAAARAEVEGHIEALVHAEETLRSGKNPATGRKLTEKQIQALRDDIADQRRLIESKEAAIGENFYIEPDAEGPTLMSRLSQEERNTIDRLEAKLDHYAEVRRAHDADSPEYKEAARQQELIEDRIDEIFKRNFDDYDPNEGLETVPEPDFVDPNQQALFMAKRARGVDAGPDLFGESMSGGVRNADLFAGESNIGQGKEAKPVEPPPRPATPADEAIRRELERARDDMAFAAKKDRPAIQERIEQLEKALRRNEPIRQGEQVPLSEELEQRGEVPGFDDPGQQALFSPAARTPKDVRQIAKSHGLDTQKAQQRVFATRRITVAMSEMLGLPVNKGRGFLALRSAAGAFFRGRRSVRQQQVGDVPTYAHETGHFLSEVHDIRGLVNALPGAAQRGAAKRELVNLGRALYGSRKPKGGYGEEGIAEIARMYVEGQDYHAAAPTFAPIFDDLLAREVPLQEILTWGRDRLAEYRAAPPDARYDAMIARPEWAMRRWTPELFIRRWSDNLVAIKRAQAEIGGPRDLAHDAYLLMDLSRSAGPAEFMIERGVIDFNTRKVASPSMLGVLKTIGSKRLEAFQRYLIARRNTKDLAGKTTGFEPADDAAIMAKYDREPGFKAEAANVYAFENAGLRYLRDAGAMSARLYDRITRTNPNHVPYRRVHGPEEPTPSSGTGGAALKTGPGVRRFSGDDRPIEPPLGAVIAQHYDRIRSANQHHAASVLVEQALSTPGGAKLVEILPEVPKKIERAARAKVEQLLEDLGVDVSSVPPGMIDEALVAFWEKEFATGTELQDRVRPILRKGEVQWVQFNDQALWETLQSTDPTQLGVIEKVTRPMNVLMRAGFTALNPDFAFGYNLFKDAPLASILDPGKFKIPGWHPVVGFFELRKYKNMKPSEAAEAFMREGGPSSGMVGAEIAQRNRNLAEWMDRAEKAEKLPVVRALRHPLWSIMNLAEMLENSTRVGVAKNVRTTQIEKGAPVREADLAAADAARQTTLPFQTKGDYGKIVNALWLFANPKYLSWRQYAQHFDPRLLKTPEGRQKMLRTTIRATAVITVPTLLAHEWQKDDERYRDIPEWMFLLGTPVIAPDFSGKAALSITGKSGRKLKIWLFPRPPGPFGLQFGYLPLKAVQWADGTDPDAGKHALRGIGQEMLPVSSIWPTMLTPFIDWYFGKSSFTGQETVPRSRQGLRPHEQAAPQTGETARLLANIFAETPLAFSPAKAEKFALDITGGAGKTVLRGVDLTIRKVAEAVGAQPLRQADQRQGFEQDIPIVRKFVREVSAEGSQSVRDLYERFDEAESYRRTWRSLSGEEQRKYFEKHREQIAPVLTEEEGGPGWLREMRQKLDEVSEARNKLRGAPLRPEVAAEKMEELDAATLRIAHAVAAEAERRRKARR